MTIKRTRVAFCIDSFHIGGTELNAVRIAEALEPDRFELFVMHLQPDGPLRSRYEKLGVHMVHFPIRNLYSIRTAMQGVRLAWLLRCWDAEIVHTHDIYSNIFAVPWARLFSKSMVIASRRWWMQTPRAGLGKVNRWSYLLAHRVLANSIGVAGLLAREEKVPQEKIIELPNFLEESAFEFVDEPARSAQRQAWGVPNNAFVIGIVARLAPVKNHVLLLKAAVQLDSRFHIVLIGDGPSRSELENLAQRLRIESRVHFVGQVISPFNLHQFFDVSVLCSLSEGFPNAVIEAMAAARPVVATPVGGVTDVVVNDATGILVDRDNAGPLIEVLQRLESDPLLCRRLGETGRVLVRKKYHKTMIIEKLSAFYEMLAGRRMVTKWSRPYG